MGRAGGGPAGGRERRPPPPVAATSRHPRPPWPYMSRQKLTCLPAARGGGAGEGEWPAHHEAGHSQPPSTPRPGCPTALSVSGPQAASWVRRAAIPGGRRHLPGGAPRASPLHPRRRPAGGGRHRDHAAGREAVLPGFQRLSWPRPRRRPPTDPSRGSAAGDRRSSPACSRRVPAVGRRRCASADHRSAGTGRHVSRSLPSQHPRLDHGGREEASSPQAAATAGRRGAVTPSQSVGRLPAVRNMYGIGSRGSVRSQGVVLGRRPGWDAGGRRAAWAGRHRAEPPRRYWPGTSNASTPTVWRSAGVRVHARSVQGTERGRPTLRALAGPPNHQSTSLGMCTEGDHRQR